MVDRMSLLAFVNDKETSRNADFASNYFRNTEIQDFIAGLIPGSPDSLSSEQNPQLSRAYRKIRESLSGANTKPLRFFLHFQMNYRIAVAFRQQDFR